MKRFLGALRRSFFATLFLAVVLSGLLALIAIPGVGRPVAQFSCADGTAVAETTNWSLPNGERGTNTLYFCESADGERTRITNGDVLRTAVTGYAGIMLIVMWPLLFLFSLSRGDGSSDPKPQTQVKIAGWKVENRADPAFASDAFSTGDADSVAERLKQLDVLLDEGLITQDEFKAKRSEILDSL